MSDHFEISTTLAARPERVYRAWLDAQEHGAIIGAEAQVAPEVGGGFSLWGGGITGRNLELEPPRRIVQSWRASDFPEGAPDSRLELTFEPAGAGTKLTLAHSGLPSGQGKQFEDGWKDHYFAPMQAYFKDKA